MTRRQQTRTSGGAYQNPTEGIVDYGAFNRGLQAGLKPGLDFLKEQEKKEEAEKKALGIKRTKLAGEIEDVEVAAGSIFGNTLNLDLNTSQDYKDWAMKTRSEILNPKTSDTRVKELQTQWANIKAANSSLQYLIDIDNDPEVYDGEASDINALFANQGTSFKDFVKAYNEGKAKPVVKTIKGVNVGVFTMNIGGKEVFLDFENKINKTTIDSKSSLNAKTSVTEAGTEFKGQSKGSFENTQEYINAEGDIVKQTSIATQYTKGVDTFAGTKAKEYLGKNPELNASIFTSALRERRLLENSLTEDELNMIDLTGKKYIGYNKKAVLALVGFEKTKALAGGIPISDSEAEALANNKIDALRNKVNNIYVKNELLKQNENFLLNPETGKAEPRGPQTDTKLGKDENERKILGAGRDASLEFKKLNVKSIKDLTPSILSKFINSKLSGLEKARAFPIDKGQEIFESTVQSTINPLTEQNYTKEDAQKMWADRGRRFPNTGLVFIDNSGELIGLNIKTTEDIAGIMADVYGYKNKGGDRDAFIKSWTEAQFEKQSNNRKQLP